MGTVTKICSDDMLLCQVRIWIEIVRSIWGYRGGTWVTPVLTVWRYSRIKYCDTVSVISEEKLGFKQKKWAHIQLDWVQ